MHLCSFYCTGERYDLAAISKYLKQEQITHQIYSKEVLHAHKKYDFFIYQYGAIVFWNTTSDIDNKIIKEINEFLTAPLKKPIVDRCHYNLLDDTQLSYIDTEKDVLNIATTDDMHFIQLAFSYGLSQSVKLGLFEESVDRTIAENLHIPQTLIKTGKILLSKNQLAKKIGTLFTEIYYINLNHNILDTPEFFWKRPKYEQYYEMSIKFLDLKQRIEVLNIKLGTIRELYGILLNELQHSHSSRLEIIVIILISLEVIIAILFKLLS